MYEEMNKAANEDDAFIKKYLQDCEELAFERFKLAGDIHLALATLFNMFDLPMDEFDYYADTRLLIEMLERDIASGRLTLNNRQDTIDGIVDHVEAGYKERKNITFPWRASLYFKHAVTDLLGDLVRVAKLLPRSH